MSEEYFDGEKELIIKKTKGNYFFPNFLASAMGKVSQRIQYEASLMSIAIILLSLLFIGVFTIFFTDSSMVLKVITSINLVAIFIFLSSNLITTYQQYHNYLEVMGFLNEIKEEGSNEKDKKIEEVRALEEVKEEVTKDV